MEVTINGKRREVQDSVKLGQLILDLGLERSAIAIELNKTIVKRGLYDETVLRNGDSVEIVHLVGGG